MLCVEGKAIEERETDRECILNKKREKHFRTYSLRFTFTALPSTHNILNTIYIYIYIYIYIHTYINRERGRWYEK